MSLTLAVPGALWLLLVIPLVWIAWQVGRTNFNRRQRLLQAAVRSLLLAVLVFSLARPVLSTRSSRQSIVYLVDVSHSIASRSITEAAAKIDAMNAATRPDAVRILVFGATTTLIPDTAALRRLAAVEPGVETDSVGRGDSDLERALLEARSELRPGERPRIVLFSDGRETSGDVHAATLRLAAEGVPVFVEPLGVRDLGDTWVDAILVPDVVPSGGAVSVTVTIGSQRATGSATVTLREGDKLLGTKVATLVPGTIDVPMDVTFEREGSHVVQATLESAGDVLDANNRLSREVMVQARTRVLYVESAAASARYLQNALTQAGYDVTLRAPAAIPATAKDLEAWDVVILSDIARASLTDAAMASLSTWVEQAGGGLLVTGGESVFGEGREGGPAGYRRSEIERLLPVTFERKDQPDVALVMVIDKSWSMNGRVMELCKAAAQSAVDALSDRQTVGVVSFDDRWAWDVTPKNVGQNRAAIRQAIANIQPGGDTLIYPALEQAFLGLQKVKASAKHVVLLSDGRSYPEDYEGLVKRMVDAGMTVSSIAVGPAADAQLLTSIAKWGKGRPYVVLDAKEVTQIFVKEAQAAMSAFDEGEAIAPVVKARSVLSNVDLSDMPVLRGRTAMVLKDTATEVLATKRDDPMLAFWPFGLGRTAVFASDVKDRWANNWLQWRGYGPFFSSVVRSLARQRPMPFAMQVTPGAVRADVRTVSVAIEARDGQGQYQDQLSPLIHVRSPDGASADVTARQVAPGRYDASVLAPADQPLTIALDAPADVAPPSRQVLPDLDAEYRLRPTDDATLRAIAAATGGAYEPSPTVLMRQSAAQQTTRRAAWPLLVMLALALWMVDIWLRRVRLFETETDQVRG